MIEMQCFVYRSLRKSDTYIYIPQKGEFSHVPKALMEIFGKPEFALEFDLTPERKLAVANAREVIKNLKDQGFYLQMPSENEFPI